MHKRDALNSIHASVITYHSYKRRIFCPMTYVTYKSGVSTCTCIHVHTCTYQATHGYVYCRVRELTETLHSNTPTCGVVKEGNILTKLCTTH